MVVTHDRSSFLCKAVGRLYLQLILWPLTEVAEWRASKTCRRPLQASYLSFMRPSSTECQTCHKYIITCTCLPYLDLRLDHVYAGLKPYRSLYSCWAITHHTLAYLGACRPEVVHKRALIIEALTGRSGPHRAVLVHSPSLCVHARRSKLGMPGPHRVIRCKFMYLIETRITPEQPLFDCIMKCTLMHHALQVALN